MTNIDGPLTLGLPTDKCMKPMACLLIASASERSRQHNLEIALQSINALCECSLILIPGPRRKYETLLCGKLDSCLLIDFFGSIK